MTAEPAAASQRRHTLWLAVIVIASHAFAFWTFGATFWVDSAIYAGLGDALFSPDKMGSFYDATGTMMYSHIGPGEPALWAFVRLFPIRAQWPVLALLQHALAASATILAFRRLQRILPGIWNLGAAALLSLHPFYQSFHNGVLTESASGSLLLIGITILIRLLYANRPSRRSWAGLLTVIFLAAQFRGYLGILLTGAAVLVLLWRKEMFRWHAWLTLLAVCIGASAAYPCYRWACIGRYFSSGVGTNMLVCAAWANPRPTPALLEKISSLGWPGDPAEIFADDFTYEKARDAGVIWQLQGLRFSEIVRRITAMSRAIVFDRPSGFFIAFRCALASSGMPSIAFAGSGEEPAYTHLSLPVVRRHERTYYLWQSWLEKPSYRPDGNAFFVRENASVGLPSARRDLWAALEPHLSDKSIRRRDPLRLGKLPLDLWAVLGLLGTALCILRLPILGLVLGTPIAGIFLLMGAAPIANGRYSYPLVSIWFLSCATAWGLYLGRKNATLPIPQWIERQRRKRTRNAALA